MSRDVVFLDPDEDEVSWSDTPTSYCPVEFVRASTVPKWNLCQDRLPELSGRFFVITGLPSRPGHELMDIARFDGKEWKLSKNPTRRQVICWLSYPPIPNVKT